MKNFKKVLVLCSYFLFVGIISLSLKTKAYGEDVISYSNYDTESDYFAEDIFNIVLGPNGEFLIPIPDVEFIVRTIKVDVKPDSKKNPVNLKSKGLLQIALLGDRETDVNKINKTSVKAQGSYAVQKMKIRDVNGDNVDDLVMHFKVSDMRLNKDSSLILVTGKTLDGVIINGKDTITLVGNK